MIVKMEIKELKKLPPSELQVMQIIWEMHRNGVGNIYANAMIEAYPEILGRLKLTTVLTLVMRLAQKKYVKVVKRNRTNCYIPIIGEDEYKKFAMTEFVATVCRNNSAEFMTALCGSGILTERDVEELKNMIKESD